MADHQKRLVGAVHVVWVCDHVARTKEEIALGKRHPWIGIAVGASTGSIVDARHYGPPVLEPFYHPFDAPDDPGAVPQRDAVMRLERTASEPEAPHAEGDGLIADVALGKACEGFVSEGLYELVAHVDRQVLTLVRRILEPSHQGSCHRGAIECVGGIEAQLEIARQPDRQVNVLLVKRRGLGVKLIRPHKDMPLRRGVGAGS